MQLSVGTRTLLAKSCARCGVFKMADQFAVILKKYRDSYCRVCHCASAAPSTRKHQQEASEGAVRHRQPWTGTDLHLLAEMTAEGAVAAEIARALNRTIYSVYTMKNKLSKGES